MQVNAPKLIVQAMKTHKRNKEVQRHGAAALGALGYKNGNMSCQAAIQEEGIDVIAAALENFAQFRELQLYRTITRALCDIATDNSKSKELIQRSGAANSIMVFMENNKKDAWLMWQGCELLKILSSNCETVQDQLAIHDCAGVVCIALRTHPKDLKVQRHGLAALGNFGYRNRKLKVMIKDSGGIELICQAMKNSLPKDEKREVVFTHKKDQQALLELCFWALSNIIASEPLNRDAALKAGGRASIEQALRMHHEGCDALQRNGAACLRRLTGSEVAAEDDEEEGTARGKVGRKSLTRGITGRISFLSRISLTSSGQTLPKLPECPEILTCGYWCRCCRRRKRAEDEQWEDEDA
jgi:hypothetical protein